MPFVTEIVEQMNVHLKSSLSDRRYQPSKFMGVTTPMIRRISATSAELIPAVIDNYGEAVPVEFDDANNLIVYHKIMSNTHVKGKAGYGDNVEMADSTDMQMIVFGWASKLKLNADQLEGMIRVNFPERLIPAGSGLTKSLITTTGTDQDKLRVFKTEFPQALYFLRPEQILFMIKYRIETWFTKACLNQCCPG